MALPPEPQPSDEVAPGTPPRVSFGKSNWEVIRGTRWDEISDLAWECLRMSQEVEDAA